MKKAIFHGHEVDREKARKELGDVLWYVAVAAHEHGYSLEDVARANVAKLRERYPGAFSESASRERADLRSVPNTGGILGEAKESVRRGRSP